MKTEIEKLVIAILNPETQGFQISNNDNQLIISDLSMAIQIADKMKTQNIDFETAWELMNNVE